ncbi:MAG: hypothetical protein WAS27_01610 [Candidatus Saccharimonadales bacterium]
MTAWCHLPTIFKQRHALRIAGLLTLCVALTTTLLLSHVSHAAPGINKTLGFQGRLLSKSGAVVPDGHYNIEFKIYQDGDGKTQHNSTGSPASQDKWTETYTNNNDSKGIEVRNGFFSVSLGLKTPFGTLVDWNQDTLWLSMNVAGSSDSCTSFNTGSCIADGEMLPMKQITATPFSLNSGALGGKTANEFVQLGQGVQVDTSIDTSSIFINKTGSGNLIQLQNGAADAFTVTGSGNLTLGSNADKVISVDGASSGVAGKSLSMIAGAGGSGAGSSGGDAVIQGGAAGGDNGTGGNVKIDAGSGTGSGIAGNIAIGTQAASSITIGSTSGTTTQNIAIGTNTTAGSIANVTIGNGGDADSGSTTLQSKDSVTIKTDGQTRATFTNSNTVYFGNGETSTAPSDFTIQGTNSASDGVSGGSLMIRGGDVTTGDGNGGNIVISGGTGNGTGVNGSVIINTPTFSTATSDPNCYPDGLPADDDCVITSASINNSAAVIVGFSTSDKTATLLDPAINTPGRVLYVMAAPSSEPFTLSFNGSSTLALAANSTTMLMWNGSDWTTQSSAATAPIQSVDNNTRAQVGDGDENSTPTLLTLDKAISPPVGTGEELLGSMYYDVNLGKVQCYEADGWGSCGASPDNFMTLSPAYANAVMHGSDNGELTTDLCSDALNINNGHDTQPTICGAKETFNFYRWTSPDTVNTQTRSIFVTYQLPANFKEFVGESTSLTARTDDADAKVSYQIYRNTSADGLTNCGDVIDVATGNVSWTKETAKTDDDPANCQFEAGDNIVIRINLASKNNASAYVSNLNFTFSTR